MNYLTSLGKTFKDYLEFMVQNNVCLFEGSEYEAICKVGLQFDKKAERIDPILEIQGWVMEHASSEAYPQVNLKPRQYSSYLLNSLINPNVPGLQKSSLFAE
jgi:hypothetical protein